MEVSTKNAHETQKLGQKTAAYLIQEGVGESAKILALYGELGSGKTTFVQGLAKGLGLPHRILSPTFIIVREYPLSLKKFKRFYHIDLYRVELVTDMTDFGFSDIFTGSQNIVVIEWAERLGTMLPKARTDIYFETSNRKRLIRTRENLWKI